ncbi:MAG: response regulator, partial [Desulfobulbaceae bacterium]|nr:response regulator [Desulfobulbaceae bacterium]
DEVVSSANRAKDLVRQILTFSRRTDQKKQLLQLSLVVKETLKLMRSSIPATIELHENITSQSTALADPTQMHQIVMNLCTNAYHAMREIGGSISVHLEDVDVAASDELPIPSMIPGKYIHLAVVDTGCGMDDSTIDNIFEPYFTTKEAGDGTGLGLAVVHGIVESHNGYISVKSAIGKGSALDVYFPLVEEDADDFTLSVGGKPIEGGSERIMFIDDEEKIVNMASKLLSQHGYQVSSFTNGLHALTEFQKNPRQFDLVITDMTMPRITGAEIIKRLVELRPELPTILCTGHSDIINRDKALEAGVSEYFEKPYALDDLLRSIRRVFDMGKAKGGRILFVDDDQCNIDLGIAMLESVGCEVVGLTDSLEALELFRNDPETFDVVITDQIMPGLDGFELAQQLLAIRPALTVCMLTGNESMAHREKAESVGIREFITKPMDMEYLLKVIGNVVN